MTPRQNNTVTWCLTCTIALLLTVRGPIAEAADLIVQVRKLTPELVSTIAKVGEERSAKAPAGTDILKLVTEYCGSANARRYYLPLFLSANSKNEEIRAGKTVLGQEAVLRIPACLFAEEKPTAVIASASGVGWDKPISVSKKKGALASIDFAGTVEKWLPKSSDASIFGSTVVASVLPGQSVNFDRLLPTASKDLPKELDDQGPSLITQVDSKRLTDPTVRTAYDKMLRQTIHPANTEYLGADSGLSMSTTEFERAVRTQDVLASNHLPDLTRLRTGSALVSSDFSPGAYSVKLKPDLDGRTAGNLVVAALPPGRTASVAVTSGYVGIIADVPTAAESDCMAENATRWPIDVNELKRVLALRTKINRRPIVGKLLILDTGFPRGMVGTSPFAADFFVRKVGNVIDPSNEPFLWTTVQPPDPPEYFYPTKKNADHGIGVLSLALGGPEILSQNVLPSNIVSPDGTIISLMGYKSVAGASELSVNGEAALQSLSGVNWGQAAVAGVNLSLEFSTEFISGNHNSILKEHPSVLYVFAAGNGTKNLTIETIQPADWGGEKNDNAITVGAAKPDGTYWIRSNWSTTRVDLAAPGCAVPSHGWDGAAARFKEVRLSGTSFAAPLVSFAGNLLRDLNDTARIKSRILSSGRHYASLNKKVRSSRMLDVPTALALQFDAVRDDDGKLRLGRINWPEGGRGVCGAMKRIDEIAQISRASDRATLNLVLKNKTDRRKIDFEHDCPLGGSTELTNISFREIDETASSLAWKQAESLDIRNLQSITFCEVCIPHP